MVIVKIIICKEIRFKKYKYKCIISLNEFKNNDQTLIANSLLRIRGVFWLFDTVVAQ